VGAGGQGDAGGIFQLSRLSVKHRSELVADFREFFHTSTVLPVADAVALVAALLQDPRSRLRAAVAGWSHPTSWETIVLSDIFDLVLRSKLERKADFRPYPRPSDRARRTNLTASQARAILHKKHPGPPTGGTHGRPS
jgi:hypothetical protein